MAGVGLYRGHWLGTGNTHNTTPFLEFDDALLVARSLRLANTAEWRAWCKSGARPANVPANPGKVYLHDGWVGYTHCTTPTSTRPRH